MRYAPLLTVGATWLALGCGDGTTGPLPDGDGRRLAAQFDRLADSVEAGGYSPFAEALRHATEIVRLTGHATPVGVTVDGRARSFLAVAEQIDFPILVCSWPSDSVWVPPPDSVNLPPVPMPGRYGGRYCGGTAVEDRPGAPLRCHPERSEGSLIGPFGLPSPT